MSRPRITVWMSFSTPDQALSRREPGRRRGSKDQLTSPPARSHLTAPVRLGIDDGPGGRDVFGKHDLGLALLPLRQDELRLGRAGLVPAQLAEYRLHRVLVEVVGDGSLVDLSDCL